MSQNEAPPVERESHSTRIAPLATVYQATWRYIGEREAADRAYCLRFGVELAPEATIALGGAWAYPLPGAALG